MEATTILEAIAASLRQKGRTHVLDSAILAVLESGLPAWSITGRATPSGKMPEVQDGLEAHPPSEESAREAHEKKGKEA